nr:nucleotide-binding protein [uncultured Rhodopila sp.]
MLERFFSDGPWWDRHFASAEIPLGKKSRDISSDVYTAEHLRGEALATVMILQEVIDHLENLAAKQNSAIPQRQEGSPADPNSGVDYPSTGFVVQAAASPSPRKIFIVHGHDDAAKFEVARLLERLDLEVIILNEQISQGRTVIEKIEDYGRVDFAVVLLTEDDFGGSRKTPDKIQNRARQNVIFELGYFIARLTRRRVCALKKGNVELLSDIAGVVYTEMASDGGWKLTLAQEIHGAGIPIDFAKLAVQPR